MTRKSVAGLLADAEIDVGDIERWGLVLIAMGSSTNDIPNRAVTVIGEALEELGRRVEEQRSLAYEAAVSKEGGR